MFVFLRFFHQGAGAILFPPDSPLLDADLPTVEEVVPDGIEANFARADRDLREGRADEAIQRLRSALEKYPYSTRLYSVLALAYAQQKQFDKVDEVFDQAIKENPRRANHFKAIEGNLYRRAGQLDRALAALQKAVLRSPFGDRNQSLNRIKQVEREIERQKRGY